MVAHPGCPGASVFFFGQDEARLGPLPELVSLVFSRAAQRPELKAQLAKVLEHQLSPYDVFPAGQVFRWALGGALRGRPRLLSQFITMGRRVSEVNRELRLRKALAAKQRR